VVDQSRIGFLFHNGLSSNQRYPLADAGSMEDNGGMIYAMKIAIERARRTIKGDKGSSADDKWLGEG